MPDSAFAFIDLLQQRKLLPQKLIDNLREQVEQSSKDVTAKQIAKLLQRKGKLTAYQSQDLLADVGERSPLNTPSPQPETPQSSSPQTESSVSTAASAADDGELGLADDENQASEKSASTTKRRLKKPTAHVDSPITDAADSVVSLDDAGSLGGGLNDLLDDPLMQTESPAADPLLMGETKKKGWGKSRSGNRSAKTGSSKWDSPLIIVGGGALLLLMLVGATLAFVLTRGSGDELFNAAEKDYLDGAYSQAINKYQKFAASHSGHPKASHARVRQELANLRIDVASKKWVAALELATARLPAIIDEPAFGNARPELAGLLPEIAAGFAELAAAAESTVQAQGHIDHFQQTMELIDNPAYLPTSQRASQNTRLDRCQEQIATVLREVQQESNLQNTVKEIQTAATAGNIAQAYALRDDLLRRYPRLLDNAQLISAVQAVTQRLIQDIKVVEETKTASQTDHSTPLAAAAALASPNGGSVAALQGRVLPVVYGGILYALAADSGNLLWRRFAGRDTTDAVTVDETAGADILVQDTQRNELIRLKAADGKLVWRLPVPESFFLSNIKNNRIILTLASGQLWEVSLASGESGRQVLFPMELSAAATLSDDGQTLWQAGLHTNLFSLNSQTLCCQNVYFLDHKAGTVEFPPAIVADHCLIPHHSGIDRSLLHVLASNDDAGTLQAAQAPLSFNQHFSLPLLKSNSRVVAITQAGKIFQFAIDAANRERPLDKIAEKSSNRSQASFYATLAGDYLFVAGDRLSAYRLQTTRGTLTPRWVNHNGDPFVAPLKIIGDYVFHTRQPSGQAGVVVAATRFDAPQAQDAGRPAWETRLAFQAVDMGMAPSSDGKTLITYCATGSRFEIPLDIHGKQAVNRRHAADEIAGKFSRAVWLPGQKTVLVGREQNIATAAPSQSERLQSATQGLGAEFDRAIAWRKGLLVPTHYGQLAYLSLPNVGTEAAIHPFQPTLVLSETLHWQRPAAIDDRQLVGAQRSGRLFLVGIERAGSPHLVALAEADAGGQAVSAPIIHGSTVSLVVRTAQADLAKHFRLPSLEPIGEAELPGRLRWGPYAIKGRLVAGSQPGGILVFAEGSKLAWNAEPKDALPVGSPDADAGVIFVATTQGGVHGWTLQNGEATFEKQLEQPLAGGPIVLGNRIAVPASDGAILFVEVN